MFEYACVCTFWLREPQVESSELAAVKVRERERERERESEREFRVDRCASVYAQKVNAQMC